MGFEGVHPFLGLGAGKTVFHEGGVEGIKFFSAGATDDTRGIKGELVVKEGIHQIRFAYTASAIDGNEFGFAGSVPGLEFCVFCVAANDFHIDELYFMQIYRNISDNGLKTSNIDAFSPLYKVESALYFIKCYLCVEIIREEFKYPYLSR